MPDWNVNLYLKFGKERTQPAIDLVSRININNPKRIIDLGCGPGNSTQILSNRWPEALVSGLDSSVEMINSAKKQYPSIEWILGDLKNWKATTPYDLIFSNAAFHWVKNHQELMSHLISQVALGGSLAFQIPCHRNSALHQLILEIASESQWCQQLDSAKKAITIESPHFYYDNLVDKTTSLDIWETEYYHVMENHQAIIDWVSSTGLRPFLDALPEKEDKKLFLDKLEKGVKKIYQNQKNNKILFPFKRLFLIAYK